MLARRPVLPGLATAVLVLGLAGCGEEGPVDDGGFSSLQAGAPAAFEELGVDVVSLDRPAAATPSAVADALAAEDVEALAYSERAIAGLAVDPDRVGGLVGVVGTPRLGSTFDPAPEGGAGAEDDVAPYVVFVFDQVDAAVFFARSDPEVFADRGLEEERSTYFSGNLVAYYAGDAADEQLLDALDALAQT